MTRSSFPRCDWRALLVLTLLAVTGRLAMIVLRPGELTQDRDAYLGLAESLRTGRGFSVPGSDHPTAYRPPLYPLVLSLAPSGTSGTGVAVVNLLSGIAAVLSSYMLSSALGLSRRAGFCAAALVAVDPLLVRYASQPMTESLCTALTVVWLWGVQRCRQRCTPVAAAWAGVWFGLVTLCRPTLWCSGVLLIAWAAWHRLGRAPADSTNDAGERVSVPQRHATAAAVLAGVLGCTIVVLPWVIRNQIVFGVPILTTTHGGYTLLLGNNREFYAAMRRDPWTHDWDGREAAGQATWQREVQAALLRDGVTGEVETDAWMNAAAQRQIQADIPGFLCAAALRQLRLWNIIPLGDARAGWPVAVLWVVGLYYAALWGLAVCGVCHVVTTRAAAWMPGVLVVISFMAVHSFYWANARMRAPLVPILALLAVRGWLRLRECFAACRATGSESSSAV